MNDLAGLPRPTGIQMFGDHGLVQYGDDSRLVVTFFVKSVQNTFKSQEEKTPIYEDQVFITIHPPGERLNVVTRPASESDKMRFPVQWSRFIQKVEQRPEGTPVDLLFPNSPSIPDMLKAHGIYTIQQLSKLSANAIDNVGMGAQEYVNMANKYLENATSGAAFIELQQKNKDLEHSLKVLSQKFEIQSREFRALQEKFSNPLASSLSPPWQEGHDAQAERINHNHASTEIAPKSTRARSKKQEVAEDASN